jgi:hypothetical protein
LLAQGTAQDAIHFVGTSGVNSLGERIYFTSTSTNSILEKIVMKDCYGVYIEQGTQPVITGSEFLNCEKDVNAHVASVRNLNYNKNVRVFLFGTPNAYTLFPNPGLNSEYIIDFDLTVPENITLKIEAGNNIHFYGTSNDLRIYFS